MENLMIQVEIVKINKKLLYSLYLNTTKRQGAEIQDLLHPA
jgi:hypothetical protein